MTPDPALDADIRHAQHLLFTFDGPIRSTDTGEPADPNAPTAPHIHEARAACNESGRTASVISINPTNVHEYLDAHDLSTQVAVVAASIGEAARVLETSPANCLFITASPADIKAAQAAGTPTIGYARTTDDAAHLVDAGAITVVYSMADPALRIRARTVD